MAQQKNSVVPYIIGAAAGGVVIGATLIYTLGRPIENNYEVTGNQSVSVVADNKIKGDAYIGTVDKNGRLNIYAGESSGASARDNKSLDANGFLERLSKLYTNSQERANERQEARHENRLEKIAREKELYQVQSEQRAQKRETRKDYLSDWKEKIDAWDHRRAQEMEAGRKYAHKVIEEGRSK